MMRSRSKISPTEWFAPFRPAVLLLIVAVLAISCDDDDDDNGVRPTENIVALAQENDNLSSLEEALVRFPDLVTALSGTGQNTVFAPTNAAFQSLLAAIGQSSLDDIPDDVLRDILEFHVVAGSTLKASQLTNGNVETAGGEQLPVSISSGVKLNGVANVSVADVDATNGVIHVIDAVMIPPSIAPIVGTIVAPAYFSKDFTTLISAVKGASPAILETLLDGDSKTLFAPTNEAFAAAGITSLPDQAVLDAVLAYHVIPAEVFAGDITDGSSAAGTLNGQIYFSKSSGGVFINGTTQVTSTDIAGSNGVVHVIDRMLIPPSQTIAGIATSYATATTGQQFTQLVAALARTQGQGANDLLAAASATEGDLTVFAPTDQAFEELYMALGVENVDEIALETLIAVLKHHIVGARVFSTDLTSGDVATLNGEVSVDMGTNPPTVTGGSGAANEAALQTTLLNIHGTNGVIHVIDKVLLP